MNRLKIGLLTAAFFPFFVYVADARSLSAKECSFIERYNRTSTAYSFQDQFLHMIHNIEICSAGINCEASLQKRTRDFDLIFHPSNDPTMRGIYAVNAAYMMGFLREATGLDFNYSLASEAGDKIMVIFTTPSSKKDTKASSDPVLFQKFLNSNKAMCLGVNFDWKQGNEYSEVWIKADQSEEEIANCIKEEIYNTSGVPSDPIGKASIFSEDIFQEKSTGRPIYSPISSKEFLVMKILYETTMKNEQTRLESLAALNTLLKEDCGI